MNSSFVGLTSASVNALGVNASRSSYFHVNSTFVPIPYIAAGLLKMFGFIKMRCPGPEVAFPIVPITVSDKGTSSIESDAETNC